MGARLSASLLKKSWGTIVHTGAPAAEVFWRQSTAWVSQMEPKKKKKIPAGSYIIAHDAVSCYTFKCLPLVLDAGHLQSWNSPDYIIRMRFSRLCKAVLSTFTNTHTKKWLKTQTCPKAESVLWPGLDSGHLSLFPNTSSVYPIREEKAQE